MRPDVFLERAVAEDVDALLALERRCFSHPWTGRHFREALRDERTCVLVLRGVAGPWDPERGVVAYCVFQVVADEMHIHDLAVHPDHRRCGLGRWLMLRGMERAARRGARRALLEVREANAAARNMYRALGFREAGVRRGYYHEPREDAVLLECVDLSSALAAAGPNS